MTKTKSYPSHTFARLAREAGFEPRLFWEIKGPKDTAIAWLSCYVIKGRVFHVITYDNDGWDVLRSNEKLGETVGSIAWAFEGLKADEAAQ